MNGIASVLREEAWASLATGGFSRQFPAGEILLRQGGEDDHLIVLLHGRVKVTRLDEDGTEMVLAIRGPGELLGEIALLDGGSHSATVTAIDSCVTRIISRPVFRRFVDSYGLEDTIVRYVLRRFREGELLRAELAALPADLRIARTLLRLAVPRGMRHDPSAQLDVEVDQTELGRIVGLSRGTVSTELATLRSQGVLKTARRRITILDLESLRRISSRRS